MYYKLFYKSLTANLTRLERYVSGKRCGPDQRGTTTMLTRSRRMMRRFSCGAWLIGAGFALILAAGRPAHSEPTTEFTPASPHFFKICKNQTYALCAVARCFVFNGLAYCKCDVMSGDSISLPFNYDDNKDICSVNAMGAENGYVASTFSSSPAVEPPNGDKAVYDCPGRTSDGAYAQCDGGICFTSTEGKSFPGFEGSLKENEIICSCPITQAKPPKPVGFQIAGPYPCQKSFFQYCKSATANTKTGSTIFVGAPTGTAAVLSKLLYGNVPAFNHCLP
jgi:hypothetical protein